MLVALAALLPEIHELRIVDAPSDVDLVDRQDERTPQEPEKPGIGFPSLTYLGVSFYPYLEMTDSGFGNQQGFSFDALLDLKTLFSIVVPAHSHVGVMTIDGGSDFDLVMVKLGTGISPTFGQVFISVTVGTAILISEDYGGGSPFTFLTELRLGLRGLLLPSSIISIGWMNVSGIEGRISHESVDMINGFFISLGIGQ
jgi:hypothetical protein